MFNILHTLIDRKKKIRYIDVGEVTSNAYLGWKLLRSKKQYVTINPTTGNIDWYYTFSNGNWHKFNKEGIECLFESTEVIFKVEYTTTEGDVQINVTSPNIYDADNGTITKVTVADIEVTLTATAKEGYEFTNWFVNDVEKTDNPLTIEVNSDTECTATFTATSE